MGTVTKLPADSLPSLSPAPTSVPWISTPVGRGSPSSYPPTPSVDAPDAPRYDIMHELREATSSPTPLSEFLHDPVLLSSLLGHRKKARRGSVPQRDRDRDRDRERDRDRDSRDRTKREKDADTASILTLVLAEEERQAHKLKALLRTTADRLDYEIRRADQAESRARTAETTAREASTRASTLDTARHQAELDAARAREEVKRYQMLAEAAERDLHRAEAEAHRVERLRIEAEKNAAEARDVARKAQQALREHQAREEGREEGRLLDLRRRYSDGHEDGFEDGRAEGYESGHAEGSEAGRAEGFVAGRTEGYNAGRLIGFDEGKKVGHEEGYDEGYEDGRMAERKHALEAFDRFMDSELGRQSFATAPSDERTQRWVEATRQFEEHYPRVPSMVLEPADEVPPLPIVIHEPVPSDLGKDQVPPVVVRRQSRESLREQSPAPVKGQPPIPIPVPVPLWLNRKLHHTPQVGTSSGAQPISAPTPALAVAVVH